MDSPSLPYFKTGLTATAVLVRSGSLRLTTMEFQNINTSDVFLQLFNAAAASDVTLGSTTPVQSYRIPASDGTNASLSVKDWSENGLLFRDGLVIAATTTATGNGAPSSASVLNLTYS